MPQKRNERLGGESGRRFPLPAILLLAVGLIGSYHFYQVNNLKIVVLGTGLAALLLTECLAALVARARRGPSGADRPRVSLRVWTLLGLPLLATAPGYLLHTKMAHFFLPVELAGNLFLIAWVVYLIGWIRARRDVAALLVGVGLTVAAVSIQAILQDFGWIRMAEGSPDDQRVLGAFGSPNALAAFLLPFLPLLLSFSGRLLGRSDGRPEGGDPGGDPVVKAGPPARSGRRGGGRESSSARRTAAGPKRGSAPASLWDVAGAVAFLLGTVALFLAQSRAAMFAWLIAGGIVLLFSIPWFRSAEAGRSLRQPLVVLLLMVLGAGLGSAALRRGEKPAFDRYARRVAAVSTFRGWASRTVPWDAALRSIERSPIFGYGLGTSYELFFEHVSPRSRAYADGRSFAHAHSEVLECLQEGGALAGLATLLLFAYVLIVTVRTRVRSRGDPLVRDVTAAVLAGIVAYGGCAAVTETSRMIGTKLAVYTLIAVALSVPRIGRSGTGMSAGGASGSAESGVFGDASGSAGKGKSGGGSGSAESGNSGGASGSAGERSRGLRMPECAVAIILVIAALLPLAPWLGSMRAFAVAAGIRPSRSDVRKLEDAMTRAPNPYGLFHLANWQVQAEQWEDARRTLGRLQVEIPHYRESDYLEAFITFQQGDLDQARILAEEAAERDRYYLPTLAMLTTIGAAQRDTSAVFAQIVTLTEWAAVRSGVCGRGTGRIEVIKDRDVPGIEVRQTGSETVIAWNAALVDQIYQWKFRSRGGWGAADLDRFRTWLRQAIAIEGAGDAAKKKARLEVFDWRLKQGVTRLVQ